MKIWVVVLVWGGIIHVKGPLPMDLAECRARLPTVEAGLDRNFVERNLETHPGMRVYGRMVKRKDIEFRCIESAKPPKITEDMRSLAPPLEN